jgi:hypothetical protein
MTVIRSGFSMAYDTLYGQSWMNPIAPGLGYTAFGNLQANTPGFFQGGGLRNNFVNQADITPAQARSQITSFIGDQKMPYAMHWNAGIQQSLWRSFTAEVKYIGSRGVNLPWLTYLNMTPAVTADHNLPVFTDQPTQAQLNQLNLTLNQLQQPIPNAFTQAGFTSPITTIRNEGNSWYHGGSVTLNQRFAGGFHLRGNYTYSHLIDDATGTALDLTTVGRERASSIFDRRHRVTATTLFDVWSLLGNRPGVLGNIFANFTLAGTYSYESPQYVTPLSGLDTGFINAGLSSRVLINPNATGNGGTDVTALRNNMGQIVAYQANDPSARFIRGGAGTFAAGGRNSLRLGETNNFDVSAVKRFSYRDRAGVEVRADAYNLFNHPQFTGGSLTSIDFRHVSAAMPFFVPGTEEFGNAASLLPANNRTLQLALRVTF